MEGIIIGVSSVFFVLSGILLLKVFRRVVYVLEQIFAEEEGEDYYN